MKKLYLLFAVLAMAISAHAADRLLFYSPTSSNVDKDPRAHIWVSSTNTPYKGWATDDENMTLIASDGPKIWAYQFPASENYNYTLIYDKKNADKFTGEIDISDANSPAYIINDKYSSSGPKFIFQFSVQGDDSWVDYELKHVDGTTKFQTEPITIPAGANGQFVLRLTGFDGKSDSRTWLHIEGADDNARKLYEGNTSVTCATSGKNGLVSLAPGSYRFVLDFNLPAVTVSYTKDAVSAAAVSADIESGYEFYNSSKVITFTPNDKVKNWRYTVSDGSKDRESRSFRSNVPYGVTLGKGDNYGTTYTVTVTSYDEKGDATTQTFNYTKNFNVDDWVDGDHYYYCGDMNLWAIVGNETRDGNQILYHDPNTGQGKEIGEIYRGTMKENNTHYHDRYPSVEEMIEYWQFKKVDDNSTLPAGITGADRDGKWYVLDLKDVPHADGTHIGRLCGQFKICKGFFSGGKGEYGGYAAQAETPTNDAKDRIDLNKLQPVKYHLNAKGTNLTLKDANYYADAKIYFKPVANENAQGSEGKIYIHSDTGKGHIYLYYWNKTNGGRPTEIGFNNDKQYNYSLGTVRTMEADKMEEVTDAAVVSNGYTVTNHTIGTDKPTYIYRQALPVSSEHRSPMVLNAFIKGQGATPRLVSREIRGYDIWLIEGEPTKVKLKFTACGALNQGPIKYNIKRAIFNANHQVSGYYNLYDNPVYMAYDPATNSWESQTEISDEWQTGATITFYTAVGTEISVRYFGQDEIIVNDDNCGIDPELQILYSHLKNTFDLANESSLQIEAELFEDEEHSSLNTTYSDVTYSFLVVGPDGNKAAESEVSNQPFFTFSPSAQGIYTVKVTATVDGETFTAFDSYPVYNSKAAKPQALPAVAAAVSNDKYYFWNLLKWNPVRCYRYGADGKDDWDTSPNATAVKDIKDIYEIDKNNQPNIIWRDNSVQTVDLNNAEAGKIFAINGKEGDKYKGKFVTYAPKEVSVYFENTYNWSGDIYAYAYCGDLSYKIGSDEHTYLYSNVWPGTRLSKVTVNGKSYYKFTYTSLQAGADASTDKIIFTNGSDVNKTGELPVKDSYVYKGDGSSSMLEQSSAPAVLYLIGNSVNDGNDWFQNTVTMTKSGSKYTASDVKFGDNTFFCFTSSNSNEWDVVNAGLRYGPANDQQVISAGTPQSFQLANNSFKIAKGTYDVTVDFSTNMVTVVKKADVGGDTDALYLISNNMNGTTYWFAEHVNMTKSGSQYTATGVKFGNDANFCFTTTLSTNWSEINEGHRYGPETDNDRFTGSGTKSFKLSATSFKIDRGTYNITVDFSDNTVTVEKCNDGDEADFNAPEDKRLNSSALPAQQQAFSIPMMNLQEGGILTVNNWSIGYFNKLVLDSDNGNGTAAEGHKISYSWAKFEDWTYNGDSYDDFLTDGTSDTRDAPKTKNMSSDNDMVPYNDQPWNYCINWHPAFYRVYMTSEAVNPEIGSPVVYSNTATSTHATTNGNVHYGSASRVARTIFVNRTPDETSAVLNIIADDTKDNDAPVYYFNLNGQRVNADNLTPGIYIRRQGSKATKVYIR